MTMKNIERAYLIFCIEVEHREHQIFFQVTLPEENPRVLALILRMVPKVNPRIFRAQG
jgi:hypothetical protein